MIARTLNVAWKELLHLRKDRVLIPFFMLGALAELALIAWATGQPIDDLDMTVVDLDNSPQSAALIQALDDTEVLNEERRMDDAAEVHDLMDKGQTIIGVVIPANYSEQLAANEQPTVQLMLNGAESTSAREAQRVAEEIIFQTGMQQRFDLQPADYADQLPQITVRYNEDLKRSWYTLPAEMGLLFYVLTVVIAALAITREREKGTYEQLLVMPLRPLQVILGKALAPMLVGYTLFIVMLGMTTIVFGVPLRGSLALLLLLALLYLLAEMGKGILLSSLSSTQLQAVLLVFVIAMVDLIFSGYAVAVETMPPAVQTLSNLVPIRHWLIILRGIMLKDAGIDVLWPHIAALVALGAVIVGLATTQYRRQFSA